MRAALNTLDGFLIPNPPCNLYIKNTLSFVFGYRLNILLTLQLILESISSSCFSSSLLLLKCCNTFVRIVGIILNT